MWGSPPRAVKQRKVKQRPHEGRTRGSKDLMEAKVGSKAGSEGRNAEQAHLSMIKEENEKDNGNDDEEYDDDDEEEEDEDDDDDDDDADEDKWPRSECWEVKYSPTLTSSPGESNVLRVHRVRSDVDYVEREHSPCNEIMSEAKESRLFNNNSTITNYNSSSSAVENIHYHQVKSCNNGRVPFNSVTSDFASHVSSTHTSTESSTTLHNAALSIDTNDDEEDDWNFGTHFQNQVNKERERLEAHIMKEDLEHQPEYENTLGVYDASSSNSCRNLSKSTSQPSRSYSYPSPSQYHHKKLHHAKRRHTMDATQTITVTDVDCHQVKITFLESASDSGFFKPPSGNRTG